MTAVMFQPVSVQVLGSWIYLLWAICAVSIAMIRPWPRPVSLSYRTVAMAVVGFLLVGGLYAGVSHAAVITDTCSQWGDGWLYWLCMLGI